MTSTRVLPSLISVNQSAFVPGRLISDNAMIAFELLHYLKRKRNGKQSYAALKTNMSKAYDRIEWEFLKAMLSKMGFDDKWISWMFMCVSTVKYKVAKGNVEIGPIIPERGLRQGDPLSPYLFIICAKGLSAALRSYEQRNLIHGCKVARSALSVTHLLFADDSYFFFRATAQECARVREILDLYKNASGQVVNFDKSSISFSKNTTVDTRNMCASILQVQTVEDHGTYLGLPAIIERKKKAIFSYVKDRVWKKI